MYGASLFVDASNTFNSLNHATMLLNVSRVCLALAPILFNSYREPVSLFVNEETLLSTEGTTQGDPLGMAMYTIGVHPLINSLESPHTQHVWYADDSAAGCNLEDLHEWWAKLCDLGLKYGYYPNNRKSCLLVTPDLYAQAMELFANTDLEIVSDGVLYLGGAIGSEAFMSEALSQKVQYG